MGRHITCRQGFTSWEQKTPEVRNSGREAYLCGCYWPQPATARSCVGIRDIGYHAGLCFLGTDTLPRVFSLRGTELKARVVCQALGLAVEKGL